MGLSAEGGAFEFAVNVLNESELAGARFSPGGETLVVGVFGRARFTEDPNEGMTCAITEP